MNAIGVPDGFDVRDDRVARAAWSRIAEPGDQAAGYVVAQLGAAPALLALFERQAELRAFAASARSSTPRRGAPAPGAGWLERVPQADPRRDLATLQRFGGRLVVPGDLEWPAGLAPLELRTPFALWVRGPADLAGACRRSVALVGSRASTRYGEWVARELGTGCAERGITVVSGAAYGIDAEAHLGALRAGGLTVAILACGVDRAYPRGNEPLIERMTRCGLVVTEIPPGSSPSRWRFVQRNRLIAALTRATVVVEAGWRSGASITAGEAQRLGRDTAAVPGPVTSAASAGCHRLLRDGAVCVTDAAEVAELVGAIGEAPAPGGRAPSADHDGLDDVDLRVFDALPIRATVGVERLAGTAGLDVSTVIGAVGRLELRGLAVREGGLWRRRPRRSRRADGGSGPADGP
ncbi:MAG TPA: DNA-processing protein DprA [Kineosporiaceae bacterium]